MKILLQLDDDLYDKYAAQAGNPVDITKELIDRLTRFQDVSRDDRIVVLMPDERRQIEHCVQTTVENAAQLIKHFKNMCTVQIGPVERQFTTSELLRVKEMAGFHGKTIEQFIKDNVEEIFDRFFDRV